MKDFGNSFNYRAGEAHEREKNAPTLNLEFANLFIHSIYNGFKHVYYSFGENNEDFDNG